MKHLLIIAENYPTESDPVFPFVAQLAEAITRSGVDVTVIAPQSAIKWLKNKKSKHPKYRVAKFGEHTLTILQPFCISFGNHTPRINFWSRKRAVERCFEKLNTKPDVCYGHFWHSGYYIYKKAQMYNLPLFIASGESVIHFVADTADKKDFCEYIKGVICVSTKNKEESIENNLTIKEKCIVAPNAIDNHIFRPLDKKKCRSALGIDDDDFVVAFVGWFGERKGSLRVSDAIERLNNDKIKSIFIGTGPAEFAPRCNNIVFKGRVPHDEIPKYLNAADVFVLPTLHEGCCNAIIEAMACGLPIISSDLHFNYDMLNAENSIMVDPVDIDAIANAISKIYESSTLKQALAQSALNIASKLTIDRRAEIIINFMDR